VPTAPCSHRRGQAPRVLALLVGCLLLTLAGRAHAHAVGLSRGDYRVAGRTVRVTLVFSDSELATALDGVDVNEDGRISPSEVRAARDSIERALAEGVTVRADGVVCAPGLEHAEATEDDAVRVTGSFECDHAPRILGIDCRFIDLFSSSHRHVATVSASGHETSYVLVRAKERVELDVGGAVTTGVPFGAMVWTGVTHIWTGYDHLAFLFGLLLAGGRARSLVGVISAFTLAHSITLGLSALGAVSVPPSIVEPAIAISVAYVGVENLFSPDPAKRWRITFPFGLVHGFGFAGALQSLDLPRAKIPAALVAFNLGVELGQLAVLAIVLPLVVWARRLPAFRAWGVPILSCAIAVAGCVWCVRAAYGVWQQ
jgi:hydrogenase/urease accessory protein HupE